MKKLYLSIVLIISCITGNSLKVSATIHMVEAQDFQFTPSNFFATTGDTIQWNWVNGGHTTTSNMVPAGADTWDALLTSASPVFQYVPTVAGAYSYICTPHVNMGMVAFFNVVNPTGIGEITAPTLEFIKSYLSDGKLILEFSAPEDPVTIQLFDITGQRVYVEKLNQTSGLQKQFIPVGMLPSGIYIINLVTNFEQRTRRVVID